MIIGESGAHDELNPGGNFDDTKMVVVAVTAGARYAYSANGNGILVNGEEQIAQGIFTAAGNYVFVQGVGAMTFTLRTFTNYMNVIDAIDKEPDLRAIIHAGGFAYPASSALDIPVASLAIHRPIFMAGSTSDQTTENGRYFYAYAKVPRYHVKTFKYVDMFFYDSDPAQHDGVDANSIQAGAVRNWINTSTKPFKIIICPDAPYTNDVTLSPGRADLRFLADLNPSAVISATARCMERFVPGTVPFFVIGTGGQLFHDMVVVQLTAPAFENNNTYGYLSMVADALTCTMKFKDVKGNVLDQYALYSKASS